MRYTVTTGFAFNKYTTRRTSPAPLLLLPQALPRPTPQHPTPRTFAQRSTIIQSDSVPHFKRLSRHDSASHRPDYNDPTGHSTYNLRIGMDDGPAPPGAQRPVGPVPVPGGGELIMRARMRATTMGQPTAMPTPQCGTAHTGVRRQPPPVARAPLPAPPMACASPHKTAQGKRRRLMNPEPWMCFHPFVATLAQWSVGVSAQCGDPWDTAALDAAVARGPHTSALTPAARQLIADEMEYQVAAGFSEIMLWTDIQSLRPRNLKISPLAVIPQVGRRGRLLLDLSFAVQAPCKSPGKRYRNYLPTLIPLAQSVNNTTLKQSPEYPVKELGRVLPRILHFMATVPVEETIMFAKIDLSDGFWRMLVAESDKWNFAYVLPGVVGQPTRLVIPHALQMGWTESPGYFCAATETGRDILQALIDGHTVLHPHVMDSFMTPSTPARRQTSPTTERPWQMSAVYVDDYILAAVENRAGTALERTGRAALHTIHGLFPSPSRSGHLDGKDPISQKKLDAGDARWAPSKELLGFVCDGQARTVHLTQRKALAIAQDTAALLKKNRITLHKFQSILGRLRHVATILPAARALFTPLNRALRGQPAFIPLSAGGEVRAALLDLKQLITTLAARPTHVLEILPLATPDYIGYCDASAFGAGGVWFSGQSTLPETVWRLQWPRDITAAVISESNPTGTLTNSDLEMAAVVLQLNVLESLA